MRLSLLVIVGQLNLIYLLLGVDFSLKRGFKEILRRDIKDKRPQATLKIKSFLVKKLSKLLHYSLLTTPSLSQEV